MGETVDMDTTDNVIIIKIDWLTRRIFFLKAYKLNQYFLSVLAQYFYI
jgi:hypothetical protein